MLLQQCCTEITEQIPDKKIAWRSTSGTPNEGVVTFQELGRGRTRITLQMAYQPQDAIASVGDALGAVRIEAKGNLKKFKELIEQRGGQETGAWRGALSGDQQGMGNQRGMGTQQ